MAGLERRGESVATVFSRTLGARQGPNGADEEDGGASRRPKNKTKRRNGASYGRVDPDDFDDDDDDDIIEREASRLSRRA